MPFTRRTLLALVLALGVMAPALARAQPAVTLYAAGSLTGALTEAAEAYAAATGAEVAARFGPSGEMRGRIEAGEPATSSPRPTTPTRGGSPTKAGPGRRWCSRAIGCAP